MNSFEHTALVESNRIPRAQNPFLWDGDQSLLDWVLESTLQITSATKCNLQTFDPGSGALEIVAHRGFRQPFLDFFKCVHGDGTACGKAFDTRGRVIVEDVAESPIFYRTAALEVLLDAGVRAVQSTPLFSPSGAILGVLSTHWPSPRRLKIDALVQLDVVARTVARWLEHRRCAAEKLSHRTIY